MFFSFTIFWIAIIISYVSLIIDDIVAIATYIWITIFDDVLIIYDATKDFYD